MLPYDLTTLTVKDSDERPLPLNNPFDTSKDEINIADIATANHLEVYEVNVTSIDEYMQNLFYLPYDNNKEKYIWGIGEYPHKENQTYTLWSKHNPPIFADGEPFWPVDDPNIIWKDPSVYTAPD